MIENVKEWAIKKTINSGWENSKFKNFLLVSEQSEFLKSQIPFYYAVQAFPRMLCKLAMNIDTSENRLLVVENIYEEHGKGNSNLFHTDTYKTYLKSLGWDGVYINNPWVDEWINNILNSNYSAIELASYLSGIEYVYALISKDITEHLENLDLKCMQCHYANHAVLDWEHGYELLSVSINLTETKEINSIIKEAFSKGQKEFLEMYSNLRIPTKLEMHEINKEKIAFYYIREDSAIENEVLNEIESENLNILSISSGGEHIFEYLTLNKKSNIDVIDMNINQIELSQKKLDSLLSKTNYMIFDENEIGKFEKIFSVLRNFFTEKELNLLSNNQDINKLKYVVDILFSNEYLNIVFGEDATKYTKKNFANHFFNTFRDCLISGEVNTANVFKGTRVRDYSFLSEKIKENYSKHKINWEVGNPKEMTYEKKYDMINLSNIGDWMSLDDYSKMIEKLNTNTKSGGCIIARKLLGDYSLKEIFERNGFKCVIKNDKTKFYSEVIVGYKI